MTGFLWLFLALFNSIVAAQNVEMNRRAKQEGFRLNLWRMGLSSLFWLPLALLQPWPSFAEHSLFYLTGLFTGATLIIGFTIQTKLSMEHNGRVAVIHMPLKALLVFALWVALMPEAREHAFANPATTAGVLLCVGVMAASLFAFRRNDVSWHSVKAVMPIVVLYAIADIFTRLTMPTGNLQSNLIIFLLLMTASSTLISLLCLPLRPAKHLPLWHPKLIRAAGWAAVGGTLGQVCFFAALMLGPSPAYVSMVMMLTPVWLLLYHRLRGIPDDASPLAGTALVLAAMALMYLVA